MPARNPEHQRAAAKVAILTRWRDANDPDLLRARQALAVARAEARIAEAAEALAAADSSLGRYGVYDGPDEQAGA